MRTKLSNHGESRRFVIGTVRCVRPHALLGAARASWLSSDAAFGAGWSAFTPGAARACVARIDRRVTGEQQGEGNVHEIEDWHETSMCFVAAS